MAERTKNILLRFGAIVGSVVTLYSCIQAIAVIPYQVTENKAAVQALTKDALRDHELLVRIDERLAELQRRLLKQP